MSGDSLDDVQRIFGAVEVELQKRHSMDLGNPEMRPHFRRLV
jgi:hypothetical protein